MLGTLANFILLVGISEMAAVIIILNWETLSSFQALLLCTCIIMICNVIIDCCLHVQ